ncbi:MAG: hypothetical protein IKW30_13485 [Lachnospiraceae bacterium]|nr:hypothetical protein [Lachnospiraceae bacterium]
MEAAGVSPAEVNMGLTEILLIIIGILAFIASFVLPEKFSNQQEVRIPEEKINALIEEQIKNASFKIEEKVDETISSAAEKTERYMERMSNEKVMAIQEYSDTVLGQINKNHEEAVFLYDMLNNKYAQVKNAAAEINNKVHDLKEEKSIEANITIEENEIVAIKDFNVEQEKTIVENKTVSKKKTPQKKVPVKKVRDVDNISNIEIQFEPNTNVGGNKETILALHQEGKSNMAIAKSLGLGIGEVKLIIDLYENGE